MKKTFMVLAIFGFGVALGRMVNEPPPLEASSRGKGGGDTLPHAGDKFCMDANGDGTIDISDPVYILGFLFLGNPKTVDCTTPPHEALHLLARIESLETALTDCQAALDRTQAKLNACLVGSCPGLPATGQTKCYDQSGSEIACDNPTCLGQDGFFRANCALEGRFIDNSDGTLTDNCTGLMWQKDTADVDGDGRLTGQDRLPWCDALTYCENLRFSVYDDWRLPNVRELQSIVDYERFGPAIDPVFGGFSEAFWSSTSYALETFKAWFVDFSNGVVVNGIDNDKSLAIYVRAVRYAHDLGSEITLDPNGLAYFGFVDPGQDGLLYFRGQWTPGSGHPYWGPTGDSNTKFNGANKWCVLVIGKDWSNQQNLYVREYQGGALNCPGVDPVGTHLYAVMNDDLFGDNQNHPRIPMRGLLSK